MQDTTGRSFGDLMHEEVLDRAQMASSTFKQSLPSGLGIIAACAHGFDGTPVAHCGNVYPETAAAGLWSTPAELARLGIELSDSLEGRAISVLHQATAALMLPKARAGRGPGAGCPGERTEAAQAGHEAVSTGRPRW